MQDASDLLSLFGTMSTTAHIVLAMTCYVAGFRRTPCSTLHLRPECAPNTTGLHPTGLLRS